MFQQTESLYSGSSQCLGIVGLVDQGAHCLEWNHSSSKVSLDLGPGTCKNKNEAMTLMSSLLYYFQSGTGNICHSVSIDSLFI
jgi:hypothetical protein